MDAIVLQQIRDNILGVTNTEPGGLNHLIYLQQIRDAILGVTAEVRGDLNEVIYLQQIRNAILGVPDGQFGNLNSAIYLQEIRDAYNSVTGLNAGSMDEDIYLAEILPIASGGDTTAPTVTGFTVPSLMVGLSITVSTFTASEGGASFIITESSTPPLSGAAGWSATAPTTYAVSSAGTYILYPWVKDVVGNVSSVYGSPATVLVETYETPAYANANGTGDRQATITVTTSSTNMYDGTPNRLVDGTTTNQGFCSPAAAGEWVRFQFANKVIITEFKFYGGAIAGNDHKWQGSNNGSTWTDIVTFAFAATVPAANTNGYMYYRVLCGALINFYFLNEFEFKIGNRTDPPTTNVLFCGDSKVAGVPEFLLGDLRILTLPTLAWTESTPRQATGGWTVDALRQGVQANIATITPAPDLVLINIGINDAINNVVTEAQWKADLQDILTAIHAQCPSAQVYLMRVWGTVAAGVSAAWVTDLHTWIGDIVALNSFAHLGPDEAVFLENGDNGATYTSDGIHPTNPAGRQLTADQWRAVLGY